MVLLEFGVTFGGYKGLYSQSVPFTNKLVNPIKYPNLWLPFPLSEKYITLIRNLVGTACQLRGHLRLGLRGVVWGSIGRVIFFRKRLRVVDRELAIQSLISFRCLYLGQIGCQGDGVSRQPGWGTQIIYDSIWEAAKFDDACTVPTPCLLLSAYM